MIYDLPGGSIGQRFRLLPNYFILVFYAQTTMSAPSLYHASSPCTGENL